ncbi:hypothetical protein FOL47_008030 [Perkinsus chesapeaki]|uniref:Uncharacterized protein n=1 Tax=Perkinsus chesapeaki TaxID=330153 RepID=A0A7J6N2G4_PERCH|nr:hypothetical protein FOL47_008030 [Perkinsus chesapeaki]
MQTQLIRGEIGMSSGKEKKSHKKHRKHHHRHQSRSASESSPSEVDESVFYDQDKAVTLIRDCIMHDPRSSGELQGLFTSLHGGGKINISQVPTEGIYDINFNPRKKLRHLLRVFNLREGTGGEWFAPSELPFNLKRNFKKCVKEAEALAEEKREARELESFEDAPREREETLNVAEEEPRTTAQGPQLPWSRERQEMLARRDEDDAELGPLPEGEERAPRKIPGPSAPHSDSGGARASWMTDCPEGMKDIWASKEELKEKAERAAKRRKSDREVAAEEAAKKEMEKYSQEYGGKSLVEIYSEGHYDKKEQVTQLRKLRAGKVDLWGKNASAQRREEALRQKRLSGEGDDKRFDSGLFNAATAGMPGRSESTVTASGRKMFDPTTDLQRSKFGRDKDDLARMHLEETNEGLETNKRDCHELAENLRNKESELEEVREAKAHGERVAEKLARDLAVRDAQLSAATNALNDKKAMFEKSTKDFEIMRKLNEQKDAKIASLLKERSRLIERLTQLKASSAAKETRSRREASIKTDVSKDPAVTQALKMAARRVSAPPRSLNSDVEEVGEIKRALADATREVSQLRRALALERQSHEATRRRAIGKSTGDKLTPQVLNPWKIHASLLRE